MPVIVEKCDGADRPCPRASRSPSRFRKSVPRFSDRNLRQNKRLSRRGEAKQVCLAIQTER
jgi:hypothetical protein